MSDWWTYWRGKQQQTGGQSASYWQAEYQRLQNEQLQRTQALAEQAKAEKDSGSISKIIGNILSKPADALGDAITPVISKGMEGLEWYDKNVVGNVWNTGLGATVTGLFGREWDENTRYENLDGAAKIAAGMVSDPLTYIPAVGWGGKALQGGRFARAGVMTERAAKFLDSAQVLGADKWAGPVARRSVVPAAKLGAGAVKGAAMAAAPDLFGELGRTLGRPTAGWLTINAANDTRAALKTFVSTKGIQEGYGQDVAPDIAQGWIKDGLKNAQRWLEEAEWLKEMGDVEGLALHQLPQNVPDSGILLQMSDFINGAYRPRAVSKRLAENFRRVAGGGTKAVKDVDLDQMDSIIRAYKANGDYSDGAQMELGSRLMRLTVGDEKADEFLAMAPGMDYARTVRDYLKDRTRDIDLGNSLFKQGFEYPAVNTDELINLTAGDIAKAVRHDLHSGTSIARQFMKNWQPIRVLPFKIDQGKMAGNFDKMYSKFWTTKMEPWIVQPFSQLILGQPLFALQNATEEVMQSVLGSTFSRHSWHLSADEFLGAYSWLSPEDFPMLQSLMGGAREGEVTKQLFAEPDVQNLLALRGQSAVKGHVAMVYDANTGQWGAKELKAGWQAPTKGWKGYVFGGRYIENSNFLSSDIRRGSFLTDFYDSIKKAAPELFDADSPTAKLLKQYNWDQKAEMQLLMSVGLLKKGVDPAAIKAELLKGWNADAQRSKYIEALITSTDMDSEAADYLRKNVRALSDPTAAADVIRTAINRAGTNSFYKLETSADFLTETVDDVVFNLRQAGQNVPVEDFAVSLQRLNDLNNVLQDGYSHYRNMGNRLRWQVNSRAQHENNYRGLLNMEAANQHFVQTTANALDTIIASPSKVFYKPRLERAKAQLIGFRDKTEQYYREVKAAREATLGPRFNWADITEERWNAWLEKSDALWKKYGNDIHRARTELEKTLTRNTDGFFTKGAQRARRKAAARAAASNPAEVRPIEKALDSALAAEAAGEQIPLVTPEGHVLLDDMNIMPNDPEEYLDESFQFGLGGEFGGTPPIEGGGMDVPTGDWGKRDVVVPKEQAKAVTARGVLQKSSPDGTVTTHAIVGQSTQPNGDIKLKLSQALDEKVDRNLEEEIIVRRILTGQAQLRPREKQFRTLERQLGFLEENWGLLQAGHMSEDDFYTNLQKIQKVLRNQYDKGEWAFMGTKAEPDPKRLMPLKTSSDILGGFHARLAMLEPGDVSTGAITKLIDDWKMESRVMAQSPEQIIRDSAIQTAKERGRSWSRMTQAQKERLLRAEYRKANPTEEELQRALRPVRDDIGRPAGIPNAAESMKTDAQSILQNEPVRRKGRAGPTGPEPAKAKITPLRKYQQSIEDAKVSGPKWDEFTHSGIVFEEDLNGRIVPSDNLGDMGLLDLQPEYRTKFATQTIREWQDDVWKRIEKRIEKQFKVPSPDPNYADDWDSYLKDQLTITKKEFLADPTDPRIADIVAEEWSKLIESMDGNSLRVLQDEFERVWSEMYPGYTPSLEAYPQSAIAHHPGVREVLGPERTEMRAPIQTFAPSAEPNQPFTSYPRTEATTEAIPPVQAGTQMPLPGMKVPGEIAYERQAIPTGGNVTPPYIPDEQLPLPPPMGTPKKLYGGAETADLGDVEITDWQSFIVNLESEARRLSESTGMDLDSVRKHLQEQAMLGRLLQDDMRSQQFHEQFQGLFAGREYLLEGRSFSTLDDEVTRKFMDFSAALNRIQQANPISPELESALGKRIDEFLAKAQKRPELYDTMKKVWADSTDKYHQWFTNYDSGKTYDLIMRHVFPFWRYEKQRWPRLARSVRHHPWLATSMFRGVDATDDGYLEVPGTGIKVNPVGGTVYGTLRGMMQDGGFYYEHRPGAWGRLDQFVQLSGFYPGPQVTVPMAMKEGQLGEAIPTSLENILNVTQAGAAVLPGGEGISKAISTARGPLDSRYRQNAIAAELAAMGIHPYEATPEQRLQAEERVAARSAVRGLSGGTLKSENPWRRDQMESQWQAALDAGIPEEVVAEARRRGKNPLMADTGGDRFDFQDEPMLNRATRRGIEEQNPEWEKLAAVRESFAGGQQMAQGKVAWTTGQQIKDMEADAESRLKLLGAAFQTGEITGKQFRDARAKLMDELRGAYEVRSRTFDAMREKPRSEGGVKAREDALAEKYYSIQAPIGPDGLEDYDVLERRQAEFIRQENVSKSELSYILDEYPRQRFKDPSVAFTESEYDKAKELNKQYYSIPKYPGLSEQEAQQADKALALAEKVRGANQQMTVAQSLAVVARYDPTGAQLARKALTISKKYGGKNEPLSPRSQFKKSQPLWQKYYGS